MTLPSGARLGPYEIQAAIGAGGMGEVYRARDTRLERTVAVKVLPEHLSASPEVRQRFEREAKTISQLSHPHICSLYDVGREGETEYLVMEYLEGETLSERLAKGALPLEQTVRIGTQIADALDKAHRQGIVHRDLKPGNVMLTKSGVKLLDFGLAKAMAPATQKASLTSLPTQQGLTQEGTILGTFQYMAPEQLEGKDADARSDVWALGCVLYEMATGKKAFSAPSQASLITAIMSSEPVPISTVQPMSPRALDRIVKTCLAKDPEDRWQSAADVGTQLKWMAEASEAGSAAPAVRRRPRRALLWGAIGLLAGAGLAALLLRRGEPPAEPLNLSLLPPPGVLMRDPAEISPDGRSIAFVGSTGLSNPALYVRPLASTEAKLLPGTEGASFPFWSPDSKSLAFFTRSELKTVDLAGGRPQVLCPVADARGGAWSSRGTILFSPSQGGGLRQVAPSGGASVEATKLRPGEVSHRFPRFLPGGEHYLVFVYGPEPGIYVGTLGSKEPTFLSSTDRQGAYASPGYLVFDRGDTLLARRFDVDSRRFLADPFAIASKVWGRPDAYGHSSVSTSDDGTLAYREGAFDDTIYWVDRSGRKTTELAFTGRHDVANLSPDGRRLAACSVGPNILGGTLSFGGTLSVLDLDRGTRTNLTSDPGMGCTAPRWSRDGSEVFYGSTKDAKIELRRRAVSSGKEQVVFAPAEGFAGWNDVSPDGRSALMSVVHPKTNFDLWLIPLSGDSKPQPLLVSAYAEGDARFSPDGRYVAYVSNETGRSEVYLRRFPVTDEKWAVSSQGGVSPRWRKDGRELFFVAPGGILTSVAVTLGAVPEIDQSERRFQLPPRVKGLQGAGWDAAPDGRHFVIVAGREGDSPTSARVMFHWAPAVRR